MKKNISLLAVFFLTKICLAQNIKVQIEQLYKNDISIRAFVLDANKMFFVSNKNRFGSVDLTTKTTEIIEIKKDSLSIEFRSIAQTKSNIFALTVGNPALLYKIDKKTLDPKLVYIENHDKVFYDGMQFSDNKNGIAFGDPIDGRFSIIITSDGGESWSKLSSDKSPIANDGEAAFAASNSTLVVNKAKVWFATGGKSTRIFKSDDFGKSWQNFETPLIHGDAMTGIFSMDFADHENGFIVGGNYEKPLDQSKNKAKSTDGGKTWQLVANKRDFGYASCVNFDKNSKGKRLATVGADGVFLSNNSGETWTQIATDKDLYVCKFFDAKTIIAAGKNKILKFTIK